MNILITGANGFIGSAVMRRLTLDGHRAVASQVRLTAEAQWNTALAGIDCVIHTAARMPIIDDRAADSLAEFRMVNVDGTMRLAQQAVEAGVKRFIFLSSIKVNGETTTPHCPFTAEDVPAPDDAYGQSKYDAEQGLLTIACTHAMEVVIIRPPLVYGPGVKGNMASLMRLVAGGIPLPLGAIRNQRSMVALDNLVDFIMCCTTHPAAANQVFLVSDGEDISTSALVRRMARAMHRKRWLVPVPPKILRLAARLAGKPMIAQRLCDSLQVSIAKNRSLLGWQPPVSLNRGIEVMVTPPPTRRE
jgi:UDP-glucose 4-epimerase